MQEREGDREWKKKKREWEKARECVRERERGRGGACPWCHTYSNSSDDEDKGGGEDKRTRTKRLFNLMPIKRGNRRGEVMFSPNSRPMPHFSSFITISRFFFRKSDDFAMA